MFFANGETNALKIYSYSRRRVSLRTWKYLFYCNSSQRIWGHFLFVIPNAVILNCLALVFHLSRKSFLSLLCLHHLLSFFLIPKTKSSTGAYQWQTLNMFIYRSLGSLGRGLKDVWLLLFKPRDLVPWCGVGGLCSRGHVWWVSTATRRASKSIVAAADVWLLTGS